METDHDLDWQARRGRAALRYAPETVFHLREMLYPSDGRTEAGAEIRHQRTPLLTELADLGNDFLVVLTEWTSYWAAAMGSLDPARIISARRNIEDAHASQGYRDAPILGFPGGETPAGAHSTVLLLTKWLDEAHERIEQDPAAGEYYDDITARVWAIRARTGLTATRPLREPAPRPCPVCLTESIRVEFFGASVFAAELRGEDLHQSLDGIEVVCELCGYQPEVKRSQLSKWLA